MPYNNIQLQLTQLFSVAYRDRYFMKQHFTNSVSVVIGMDRNSLTCLIVEQHCEVEWVSKLFDETPYHSLCLNTDLRRGFSNAANRPWLTYCTRHLAGVSLRKVDLGGAVDLGRYRARHGDPRVDIIYLVIRYMAA